MTYPQQPLPPRYYAPVPPLAPTSGLAIAGFVFSLVWGFGFLSPIGLALSLLAVAEIKRTGKRGSGLAGWGIALGVLGTLWLVMWLYALSRVGST